MRVYLSSIGRKPSYPFFPFFFSPESDAGFSLFCAPPCISAPVSILPDAIRPFRMSFPRHRIPVFFPLYGEVRSSLLRFNPATISRPLRTSTSRLFFILFAGLQPRASFRPFRRLMVAGGAPLVE